MTRTIALLLFALSPLLLKAQGHIILPQSCSIDLDAPRVAPMYIEEREDNGRYVPLALRPCGSYLIDGKYIYFECFTNEKGQLHGQAYYYKKRKTSYVSTLTFENGLLLKTRTINVSDSSIYSETLLQDSVLTEKMFFPTGQVEEVELTDYRIKDNSRNSIRSTYYAGGQLRTETNKLEQTYKVFTENGTPERFMDDKNGTWVFYNSDGSVSRRGYKNGNEFCREEYTDGKISSKDCFSDTEAKTYFYVSGKLQYIQIDNLKTGETVVTDANGKPIDLRPLVTPVIRM